MRLDVVMADIWRITDIESNSINLFDGYFPIVSKVEYNPIINSPHMCIRPSHQQRCGICVNRNSFGVREALKGPHNETT